MFCKMCKKDKKKEPITKGNYTRFVDDNDQVWNGKVCPDCYRVYNRDRMKKARAVKKLERVIAS